MSGPNPETLVHPPPDDLHAPISKLPNEILLEIFMVIWAVHRREGKRPFLVTHICHHWRELAISAPLLWVAPRSAKYECVKLMLERSDPADLDIVLESSMPLRTVEAIMHCMQRIGSLVVQQGGPPSRIESAANQPVALSGDNPAGQLMPWLLRGLSQPPRRLRSLELVCYLGSTNDTLDATQLCQHLQRSMEHLRRLSLMGTNFDWSILPVRNLTHLRIIEVVGVASPISSKQLIGILGQMPFLESLTIDKNSPLETIISRPTLPFTFASTLSQLSKATLLSLKILVLPSATVDFAVYFLAHTIMPRLRCMVLGMAVDEILDDADFVNNIYTPLMSVLTETITNGNFGAFEGLNFHPISVRVITPTVIQNDPDLSVIDLPFGRNDPFWYHRTIDGRLASTMLVQDLLQLRGMPSLANISNTTIPVTPRPEQLLNERLFFSSLETLTIYKPGQLGPMLTFLSAVTHPQNTEDTPLIPLPRLKVVCMNDGPLKDLPAAIWDGFCAWLALRASVGLPLHNLIIINCATTSEQVSFLENAVTTGTIHKFTMI